MIDYSTHDVQFAIVLPETHPANFEGEDLLFDNVYSLHDIDADLEFVGVEFNRGAVFEYEGAIDDLPDATKGAIQWLKEIKGED